MRDRTASAGESLQRRNDSGRLEEGMITTDEPGVYLEGEYGIRTENELICVKAEKNEYVSSCSLKILLMLRSIWMESIRMR